MYILDKEEQQRLLSGFTCIEDDAWSKRYVDAAGHEWTLYHPFSAMHGGGPAYLRRGHLPDHANEIASWVISLLRAGRQDDAIGAGTDLRERYGQWPVILSELEDSQVELPPEMVATFIKQLGITNPANRRPILGKSVEEITEDAAYFSAMAKRAASLL